MKKFFAKASKAIVAGAGAVVASAGASQAAFTMPTLPTTDLETAGTAVAALVAVFVVIRMAIRMIKGQ